MEGAPVVTINPPPPLGAGIAPGPGIPPARFAGWSPVSAGPGMAAQAPVPYPIIKRDECLIPGFGMANVCLPGPGKCVVPAVQPVIPVPVHQNIERKDRIVKVPQTVLIDKMIPQLYTQEITHDVPDLDFRLKDKRITVPRCVLKEKIIEISVPVGYNFKIVPTWEVREVPKVIPKYVGEQQILEVEVPQVKVVDTKVEKEVPVYVGEKTVEKTVVEEEYYEVIEYKYIEQEQEVPIIKYKPVFDVEVDIPPPLIVPIPVKPQEQEVEVEDVSYEDYLISVQSARSARCRVCFGPCGGCEHPGS